MGWIATNEWLEYTVNITESGLYSFAFRYASGNAAGGGPFHLELDGDVISSDISVPSTSTTSWDVWATKTVADIPLTQGEHILRVAFSGGEFNIGKMTFTRTGDLPYSIPVASAGSDVKVLWPLATATLDGSASTETAAKALTYQWSQIYGPSVVTYSDNTASNPTISVLIEGIYRFKLTVTNTDLRTSDDEVMVIVSSTANIVPSVSLTAPLNNSSYPEGTQVIISANASDFDGTIQQVEFFQNGNSISVDNSAPYSTTFTSAAGDFAITAVATDNGGAIGTSQVSNIKFEPVMSCTASSTQAQQGSFTVGYKYTFETIGSEVTVKFELYDDKAGVVAYLWNENPFSEKSMNNVSGKIFASTLSGQTAGSTISVACKFAFAGGQAVTKYISYTVGTSCTADTQATAGFTATTGSVTASSVELLLNATDNSGSVVYSITYGGSTKTVTAASGVATVYTITGLSESTNYSFSVAASDITGNVAANNPITLSATTLVSTNNACNGTSSQASQGSFDVGYKYSFVTSGTDVNITFELLDNKSGVVAYLWNTTSGFTETAMSNSGGKTFTITLTGKTTGTTLKLACKFAFAGGLAVTKSFDYVVGDACTSTSLVNYEEDKQFFYPNPVVSSLYLNLSAESNLLTLRNISGDVMFESEVDSTYVLDMSGFTAGIYFIQIENRNGIQTGKIIKM